MGQCPQELVPALLDLRILIISDFAEKAILRAAHPPFHAAIAAKGNLFTGKKQLSFIIEKIGQF